MERKPGTFRIVLSMRSNSLFSVISVDAEFSHNLFSTPANAWMISSIRTSITFSLDLFRYTNQVIAILFAQTTALSRTFPKIAFTAVAWLVCGISYLLHILTSHRLYFPDNSGIKKERLSSPGVGANKRST